MKERDPDPALDPTIVACAKAGLFDTDIPGGAILKNCQRCKVPIWVSPLCFKVVTGPKILLCGACANKDFEENPGSFIHPSQPMALLEALIHVARQERRAKN
jgi:hypothetical protein